MEDLFRIQMGMRTKRFGSKTDKFKDLTDFEKHYVAPVTSAIFGNGTNSILFKIVREKNGLCYTINSSVNRFNNSLVVYAGINKKDASEH